MRVSILLSSRCWWCVCVCVCVCVCICMCVWGAEYEMISSCNVHTVWERRKEFSRKTWSTSFKKQTERWSGNFAWSCSSSGVRCRMDVVTVDYGVVCLYRVPPIGCRLFKEGLAAWLLSRSADFLFGWIIHSDSQLNFHSLGQGVLSALFLCYCLTLTTFVHWGAERRDVLYELHREKRVIKKVGSLRDHSWCQNGNDVISFCCVVTRQDVRAWQPL